VEVVRVVNDLDQVCYSRAARLRVVLANHAAEIADLAAALVPADADDDADAGAFIRAAHRVTLQAQDLLATAIAWERLQGASWEVAGQELGVSGHSAHEQHAGAVARAEDAVTVAWLLAGEGGAGSAAERAPAETARHLDCWLARQPRPGVVGPGPAWVGPVSGHLPAMDAIEHAAMLTAAVGILAAAREDRGAGDRYVRRLETGLARRRVGLYERMLAEETVDPGGGSDTGVLRDLLAAARARLAQLEGGAFP
jgi:hypothetical protein